MGATTSITPPSWATTFRTEPLIFLKPATAVIGPDAAVVLPPISNEVHHEAELAAVVGRVARNVQSRGRLPVHPRLHRRQRRLGAGPSDASDGQWTRAKGFDTFCPLGPAIETELDPLERLAVICRVNGEVRQAGFTSDMVFGVAEIIEFVTTVMTLLPGDVVLTGTPAGVGKVDTGRH